MPRDKRYALLKEMKKGPINVDELPYDSKRVYESLVYTNLSKDGGLTPQGAELLRECEVAAKQYGSKSVQTIPKNVEGEGKYTFKVWVSPATKERANKKETKEAKLAKEPKIVQEIPTAKDDYISNLISEKYSDKIFFEKNIEDNHNTLSRFTTSFPYSRSFSDRKKLDGIVKDIQGIIVDIKENYSSGGDGLAESSNRSYVIHVEPGKHIATLISQRSVVKSKGKMAKFEPKKTLIIDINNEYTNKQKIERLLEKLDKEFK